MIDQLPRYVGSLSINPLVEESVHDRVFFALAAGVVPVTDGNAFTDENMPALEAYRFSFQPATDRASGGSRSWQPLRTLSLGSKIPGAPWQTVRDAAVGATDRAIRRAAPSERAIRRLTV